MAARMAGTAPSHRPMIDYALIIPDATPLITLAAADSLDLLLKPGLPIAVPDGVHFEAVRFPTKLGAADLVQWLQDHPEVRIEPTVEFQNAMILFEAGRRRVPGLGERCAIEVADLIARRAPDRRSILLYEDSDVLGMRMLRPDLVDTLTTADFLDQLELSGLLQSADHILDRAIEAGRDESVRRRGAHAAGFSDRF